MAIDRNRGAFVQDEYRYEVAKNDDIKAKQSQARVIEIDTNLDLEAAKRFADEILSEQGPLAQAYSFTFQGVDIISPSDFDGSPPTYRCNFPSWPVELTDLLRVVSVEVNYESWTTTVLIKGAIR